MSGLLLCFCITINLKIPGFRRSYIMYEFTVNGKQCSTDVKKNLLAYLREDLKLTGTKNGCGEGVCGACTVILDGKTMRACVLTTERV